MTDKTPDDRWLEVLAGRAEPHDHATAQAAKARAYVAQQVAADLATPVDEQRTKRLLNLMQAQAEQRALGQALAKPAGAASSRPGAWARLLAWLNPAQGGGLRVAGVAAMMGLAAVLVTTVFQQGDDDPGTMKSLPPTSMPSTQGPSGAGVLVVVGTEPLSRALALQATLKAQGITSEVFPLGDRARLDASVPAEQLATVRQTLAGQGITWEGGPSLSLEFRSGP